MHVFTTLLRRNLKTQLYFSDRRTVWTNPSRKLNFSSVNWKNLKTPALRLSVDWNHLKTELFQNDDVTIITWFPWPRFPQKNPKWPVIVWAENVWFVFRMKTSVSKFLQRSRWKCIVCWKCIACYSKCNIFRCPKWRIITS